jgi:hypothetical protein
MGARVVVPQGAAAPVEGVLVEVAGLLVFAQRPEVGSDVVGGVEGGGVVVADGCGGGG